MRIRNRVVKLCCLVLTMIGSNALNTVLNAQSTATVSGDYLQATAGQPVKMQLTFDKAATCSHNIYFPLDNRDQGHRITLTGTLVEGKNTAEVAVVLPKDYRGKFIYDAAGTGTTPAALLYPCEGYSNETPFTASAVSINIKGLPDPNSYPSTASVSLAVTQQQFLDTKVAELETLATRIDTRVEANGRDTRTLRDFLAVVVSKAEEDLDTTEKEYQRVMLKAGERIPPFFTDFRKKYENLHVELLAPIPGESARIGTSPHLVLVQQTLQRRPHNTNSGASGNQSGSSPVIANGTKALIEDNASAYRIAKLQGSQPKFHATFKSIPDKATLYYRPEFEPNFDTYSKTTNIDGADFPLGWYVFKFHKDDCQDEPVKTINANEDTTPEIFVEFQKCKRK